MQHVQLDPLATQPTQAAFEGGPRAPRTDQFRSGVETAGSGQPIALRASTSRSGWLSPPGE